MVLCDINETAIQELEHEIKADGGKALAVKTDVQIFEEVQHAVDLAVANFGSCDVTISFAGGEPARMLKMTSDFREQPPELIDWGVNVNGKAPIYLARAAINPMIEQKRGVIISIGSIDGVSGGALVYSMAKSGLIGFTKSLARYGAPYGIRACCVSPGPVLTRPSMANMKTLLGRAAEPQEIIDLCLYIASEKGQFINGENIMIDGGRNAMGRWQ